MIPKSIKDVLNLSEFGKLLIINLFRPDKFCNSLKTYISKTMGQQYTLAPNGTL